MKHLCIIVLLLPFLGFSQNKTYLNGYLVTATHPTDTLFGEEIMITANSFVSVKLKNGKKKTKYEKANLIDFGYIRKKDKKHISKYTEMAFLKPTFKGCYLSGINQDTIHCYVQRDELQSVFQKITIYNQGYQTMNGYKELSLHELKSFMIIDYDGKEVWYDAIRMELEDYEIYGIGETIHVASYIKSYGIRLSDGEIRLNKTQARIRGNFRRVYILEKDYKTTIIYINRGLLNINAKEKLAELMSDAPHLLEKLHEKGYEYTDIEDIVREYNDFKSK